MQKAIWKQSTWGEMGEESRHVVPCVTFLFLLMKVVKMDEMEKQKQKEK